jgi:tetratricopeptide (TPR) repeat protein
MHKSFWLILFILGIFSPCGLLQAEEPKKDEPKQEESKKDETKKPEKKTESVEKRMERRKKMVDEGVLKEDWDQVLAGLDEIIDDKEINADDQTVAMFKKFEVLACEKLDGAKACPVAKKLSEMTKDDAELLNDLAWTILDTPGLKNRDLDLALDIAKKATESTQGQSAEILDTLARAYFEKDDLDKAVEWQTKAVEKMKSDVELTDDIKEEVKAILEKYKTKQAEKKKEKKEDSKEEKKAEAK